jgi:hypothetical protein
MAITAARVTVSTTAVALNVAETDVVSGATLIIRNIDATDTADLGPSGVTAGTGFRLAPGETVTVPLAAGDQLFAIRSAAADVDLTVLRIGV